MATWPATLPSPEKAGYQLAPQAQTIRTEMERGVFDIEAVKKANATLIATINESLAIADEGKKRRSAAEADLQKMEAELRDTLASAQARTGGLAGQVGASAG